jgi:hypothetical protein|tara:strand:+ start:121 stop:798 length:678 start_codon:yes stop_codon:yes gene_type:complete
MTSIRVFLLLIISFISFTDDHESDENMGFILLSTYEMAYGSKYADLEKNLITEAKAGVKDGYDSCSLYRHAQGSQRAFYMVCSFKTMDQFAKIMEAPRDYSNDKQLFASHSDHILSRVVVELDSPPPFVMFGKWKPGPNLSMGQFSERMSSFQKAFSKGFKGCNEYIHAWGPEYAGYLACGFNSWKDFAKKSQAAGGYVTAALNEYAVTGIVEHSDELLVRVYPK